MRAKEEDWVIVAHADSIRFFWDGEIQVFDHMPGFPEQVITSAKAPPLVALSQMVANPDSDVEFLVDAQWNLEAVSFSDTTYVASSADRQYVAFGDGGCEREPREDHALARGTATLTAGSVADLVNNASERVNALELNQNGTLGVARGAFGTYFFSNDLRLRGTVPEVGPGGRRGLPSVAPGSGASVGALHVDAGLHRFGRSDDPHPRHGPLPGAGHIPIRDAIAGPMRVAPPLPSDNNGQGANCTGPDCVVAKLYAVTEAGGIVVVDIRASHIQPVS
jgi:hypothetical protein